MRNGPHLLLCSLQEPCVTPARQALLSSINAVAVSILDAREVDSCSSDWNSDTGVCFAGVMALRTLRARSRSSSLLTQHAPEAGWAVPHVLSLQQVSHQRKVQQLFLGCPTHFKVCNRCSYCDCTEEFSATAPDSNVQVSVDE